jgi:hypothetical protein
MKPKPPTNPTPAEYAGQTARLCALLHIEPPPDAWQGNRERARFEAVAEWARKENLKIIKNKSCKESNDSA